MSLRALKQKQRPHWNRFQAAVETDPAAVERRCSPRRVRGSADKAGTHKAGGLQSRPELWLETASEGGCAVSRSAAPAAPSPPSPPTFSGSRPRPARVQAVRADKGFRRHDETVVQLIRFSSEPPARPRCSGHADWLGRRVTPKKTRQNFDASS